MMHSVPMLRRLEAIAIVAMVAGCGFDARPKSGTVACKPQGGACCPESFVCVGRGLNADGGASLGACWHKQDLPVEALATMHDHTPAVANDPGCLVTDWLPAGPAPGDTGGQLDATPLDVAGQPPASAGGSSGNPGPVAPGVAGRSGDRRDLGPDIPIGQDSYVGPLTDGAMGSSDATTVDIYNAAVDGTAEASPPVLLDGAAGDAAANVLLDGAAGDAAANVLLDGAAGDAAPLDGALDLPMGADTGAVIDTNTGRTIASIATHGNTTCAVVNGGLQCWGMNLTGQLGDGTYVQTRPRPGKVVGLDTGVSAVAMGDGHTCAVVNGGAKCWGGNMFGELGDNTTHSTTVPVSVYGLDSGVTTISAGGLHTCAVVGGAAKCWGSNTYGQLGDGTTTDRKSPVQVTGLTSGVTDISAGGYHSCAVVHGSVLCWGNNESGQLGDGTRTFKSVPNPVTGLGSGALSVKASWSYTCAVVNGSGKCWGENYAYQLGDGTTERRLVPVQVLGLEANVTAISEGCAIVGGAAKCWGTNLDGELGIGVESNWSTGAVQVFGLTAGVTEVAAGEVSCANLTYGMACWGYGFLGNDPTEQKQSSVPLWINLL